jgi:hypothetical protein
VIFDKEGEEGLKGQVPHLGGTPGFVNGGMVGAIAFHVILKTSLWSFLEVFLVLLDGCPELWEEELLKADLVELLQRLTEEDEGLQKPCDTCCGRDSHNESESRLEERVIKVRFPRSATRDSHDQKCESRLEERDQSHIHSPGSATESSVIIGLLVN